MKVPDTEELFAMCTCLNCPTYNDCTSQKDERLFCSRGKTACEMEKQGCICGECPVYSRYRLHELYYCVNGAAE